MPDKTELWLLDGDDIMEFTKWTFTSEEKLRVFLEAHPRVLGGLLFIAREVATYGHGALDLLAIDSAGRLWVIELKRGPATRKIMEQTLGYTSWCATLTLQSLERLFAKAPRDRSLAEEFEHQFGTRMPGRSEMGLVIAVIAAKIDEHAHCQLALLESFNVPVRAYEYGLMCSDGHEALQMRRVALRPHRHIGV